MYHLGIDLGGTNIAVGVVDENFKIVGRGKMKTNAPRPAEEICDDMATAAKMAIEDAGLTMDDIDTIGIGSPGSINPFTGVIAVSNNLRFENVAMGEMLKSRLGREVFLENDANAAAYGEFLAGAGRGTKDMVAITLGTGVGGGISKEGDTLLKPITQKVSADRFTKNVAKQTEVKIAELGNDAGIIGAAFIHRLYR